MNSKSKSKGQQLDLLKSDPTKPVSHWRPFPSITPRDFHSPALVTQAYDTYWYFAAERQNVFFNRLRRSNASWTDDPILTEYKFTNAYRAADRVSQYLIRNVIYRDDLPSNERDVFFRTILFKLFNRIETWEHLEREVGPIAWEAYDFRIYDAALKKLKKSGQKVYSAAYIMHPGSSAFGYKLKHQNHLKLLERMMEDELPLRIAGTKRMQEGFDLLKLYPTIGDFLGYQFITDLNYSEITDYSEMEFVIPGPGALDGISKCFASLGGLNEVEIIRYVADIQEEEFERLGLSFQGLWGRRLQLIDCQNLFCEVSKYTRVSHPDIAGVSNRTRIKQKFSANNSKIHYWFPPKWGIDTGDTS